MKIIASVFVGLILLTITLSGWFFTLIIDLPLLLVMGFFMTYFIYRYLIKVPFLWPLRKFYPLLFPISIIALYLGGILPYFNLIAPEKVYFNLIPSQFLGISGNDFMWNGLILPFLGRIVPLNLIPTYHSIAFTIVAIEIWLAMPFVLGFACLLGWSSALENAKPKEIWPVFLGVLLTGIVLFLILVGIATILAHSEILGLILFNFIFIGLIILSRFKKKLRR
jgi:hypothetical protein